MHARTVQATVGVLTAGITALAFLAGVVLTVLWFRSGAAVPGRLTRLRGDIQQHCARSEMATRLIR